MAMDQVLPLCGLASREAGRRIFHSGRFPGAAGPRLDGCWMPHALDAASCCQQGSKEAPGCKSIRPSLARHSAPQLPPWNPFILGSETVRIRVGFKKFIVVSRPHNAL